MNLKLYLKVVCNLVRRTNYKNSAFDFTFLLNLRPVKSFCRHHHFIKFGFKLGMDDLFLSRLFAWDSMQSVSHVSNSRSWRNAGLYREYKNILSDYTFDMEIGRAIWAIWNENQNLIYDCFLEVWGMCRGNADLIKQLAFKAIPVYFPDGYTSKNFLVYCAVILGTGRCYCIHGIEICGEISDIIACVLSAFIVNREFDDFGGMAELGETSREALRNLGV